MKLPDADTIVILVGWLAHFLFGRVSRSRHAATLADALRIGKDAAVIVHKVAKAVHIDTSALLVKLRREVERAAMAIGLPPELLERAYDTAEAELGRLMLLGAFADLEAAADDALPKIQADRKKLESLGRGG